MTNISFEGETRLSLLRRVGDRTDSDGWREFKDLYDPLLFNYARRQGLAEHDARDAVQEVYVKLLQELPSFKLDHSRGRFRTWLWQVTHNTVRDQARKRLRQSNAERSYRERTDILIPSPLDILQAEFAAAHRRRVLEIALKTVKNQTQPATWACYEQHILFDRPSATVAAELGLTVAAVNTNASRVHKKVRERCAYYQEELRDD
jgi:RNA polymerase sigma-70 factor (ECF subfamily)